MNQFLSKKIAFKGTLTLLSGLHIGDSDDRVQIGGMDNSVVRRVDNNEPYIPGSSLRGKIRSLLEQSRGINGPGDDNGEVSTLFGKANRDEIKASRLIVRDAYLTRESAKTLEESQHTDFPYTEVKFEVAIDRIKGSAKDGSIHKTERVPVGSVFNIEFVINVWSDESEAEHITLLREGVALLEADYLGGSGSRGYGQVKIDLDFNKPEVLYGGAGAK